MGISLGIVDWIICIAVVVGSIVVGLWISVRERSSQSSAGFFLAGRSLTWPIVGASLFATNIGAEHLVGLSGDANRYGLCAGANEMTTAICLGFTAAILLPFYVRTGIYTIPEFLELRYSRHARAYFSAFMLVVAILTKTAFTLFAGALVLNALTGWEIMPTVAALGLLAAVVTIVGGFTTVAYTDAIQTVIMLVGSGLMTIIGIHKVGGWHALCTKVPEAMHVAKPFDDPNYPIIGILLAAVYGGIFYWGIDQVNVQRLLGAKDLKQARWGAMFSVLLKLTPVFIFALPGVIALALYPDAESKTTFATLINQLLPVGLKGLLLASLLAALLSSLLAILNSISTLATRDLVLHFKPDLSELGQVIAGRLAILIGALLGIGAAYLVYKNQEGLYKYLQTISIYLLMPVTPSIVFGIMSRRVTLKGASASIFVGIIFAAIFTADSLMGAAWGEQHLPWLHTPWTLNYAYRGFIGTVIVIVTLFLVSAFTEKTDPDKLKRTTVLWGEKREPFTGLKDWRLQWWALAAVTVLLFYWLW